jgi:hypothetical protein
MAEKKAVRRLIWRVTVCCAAVLLVLLLGAVVLIWLHKPPYSRMTSPVTNLSDGLSRAYELVPEGTAAALTGIVIYLDSAKPTVPTAVIYTFESGNDVRSVSFDNYVLRARLRSTVYIGGESQRRPAPDRLDLKAASVGYAAAYAAAASELRRMNQMYPHDNVSLHLRNADSGPVWEVVGDRHRESVMVDAVSGQVLQRVLPSPVIVACKAVITGIETFKRKSNRLPTSFAELTEAGMLSSDDADQFVYVGGTRGLLFYQKTATAVKKGEPLGQPGDYAVEDIPAARCFANVYSPRVQLKKEPDFSQYYARILAGAPKTKPAALSASKPSP